MNGKIKQSPQSKYNTARGVLLTLCLFSIVNIAMLFLGDTYFICSIVLSYFFAANMDGVSFVIAGLIIAFFFVCYLLSKRKGGWLIPALIFYILDFALCVLLTVYGYYLFIDIIVHIVFIVLLCIGIKNRKLGVLTDEELLAQNSYNCGVPPVEGGEVVERSVPVEQVNGPEVFCNVTVSPREGGKNQVFTGGGIMFGESAFMLSGRGLMANTLVGRLAGITKIAVLGYDQIIHASLFKKRVIKLITADTVFSLDTTPKQRERLVELLNVKGVRIIEE